MSGLVIEGLRKSHDGNPVLDGLNLAIPEGCIAALLGSSGCGKTTLLRLVAGFDPADGGRITLGGTVVSEAGRHVPAERRRVGYVPQEGALFPHLTVAGNVGYGLDKAERRGSRIGDLLQLTGLAELALRYPHQLSGGQQQRTALARALAPRPQLTLLDEPFNALDADLRQTVCLDVVAALRRSGTTAILVTHDPAEAFAAADLIAVMRAGAIEQIDDPVSLYQRPKTLAAARLTGGALLLDGTAAGWSAETDLGDVALHAAFPGPPGPATILLRPEQLVLCAVGEGVGGTVERMLFRGGYALLEVALAGRSLFVRIRPGDALPPGAPVTVRIDGKAGAFPADQRATPP